MISGIQRISNIYSISLILCLHGSRNRRNLSSCVQSIRMVRREDGDMVTFERETSHESLKIDRFRLNTKKNFESIPMSFILSEFISCFIIKIFFFIFFRRSRRNLSSYVHEKFLVQMQPYLNLHGLPFGCFVHCTFCENSTKLMKPSLSKSTWKI